MILLNFYDVKGLLIFFIRSNDLVVFLEYMKLYCLFWEEVLDEVYEVFLDKVVVICEGIDVFVIIYGVMVCEVIKVVDNFVKENIFVEIIDFCIVVLLDVEMII